MEGKTGDRHLVFYTHTRTRTRTRTRTHARTSGKGLETSSAFPFKCMDDCDATTLPHCPSLKSPFVGINATCQCINYSERAMRHYVANVRLACFGSACPCNAACLSAFFFLSSFALAVHLSKQTRCCLHACMLALTIVSRALRGFGLRPVWPALHQG